MPQTASVSIRVDQEHADKVEALLPHLRQMHPDFKVTKASAWRMVIKRGLIAVGLEIGEHQQER